MQIMLFHVMHQPARPSYQVPMLLVRAATHAAMGASDHSAAISFMHATRVAAVVVMMLPVVAWFRALSASPSAGLQSQDALLAFLQRAIVDVLKHEHHIRHNKVPAAHT